MAHRVQRGGSVRKHLQQQPSLAILTHHVHGVSELAIGQPLSPPSSLGHRRPADQLYLALEDILDLLLQTPTIGLCHRLQRRVNFVRYIANAYCSHLRTSSFTSFRCHRFEFSLLYDLIPVKPATALDGLTQTAFRQDGFVKSPSAALRFIFRHCSVRICTPHSSSEFILSLSKDAPPQAGELFTVPSAPGSSPSCLIETWVYRC
jgi:hypothetical protein